MIKNKSLVSVIIPSYNRAHTLKRALDSILIQDYRPLQVIVIDDASTDNTEEFLKEYKYTYAHEDKISWIFLKNKKNLRIGRTRNKGLEIAQGEYIAFLDSDDEWIRGDKLTAQVDFLDKNADYGFVATATKVENAKFPPNFLGVSDDFYFRNGALSWCPYQTSSWLIRTDIVKKIGGFWQYKCEDYEYLLKIGRHTKCGGLDIIGNKYISGEGDNNSNKVQCYLVGLFIVLKYSVHYPGFLKSLIIRLFRGINYYLKYVVK